MTIFFYISISIVSLFVYAIIGNSIFLYLSQKSNWDVTCDDWGLTRTDRNIMVSIFWIIYPVARIAWWIKLLIECSLIHFFGAAMYLSLKISKLIGIIVNVSSRKMFNLFNKSKEQEQEQESCISCKKQL